MELRNCLLSIVNWNKVIENRIKEVSITKIAAGRRDNGNHFPDGVIVGVGQTIFDC